MEGVVFEILYDMTISNNSNEVVGEKREKKIKKSL
jgi:hypothetical protein